MKAYLTNSLGLPKPLQPRAARQLQVALPLLFACIVLLTGCQTVSTSHIQDVGGPRYAPSTPAQVEILRTAPTRPHVRLGEIRAEPSQNIDVAKIEEALRQEAAKLGADAALVVSDQTQIIGAQISGHLLNRSLDLREGRLIVAVAIKYL